MTILYQAPAGRARRWAVLAAAAVAIGAALAWVLHPAAPEATARRPAVAVAPATAELAWPAAAAEGGRQTIRRPTPES